MSQEPNSKSPKSNKKNASDSIIKKESVHLSTYAQDYFSDEYFNDCAKSPVWRKALVDALYEFSSDPANLFVMRFCQKYKIKRDALYYVRDRYPEVKEAYGYFTAALACNRHDGAAYKKLDGCVFRGIGRLDPEYLEDMKQEAEINKKQDPVPPAINVIMTKPEVIKDEKDF